MGKYGIGARVRDDDGDEGVIVGKRKGERQVEYNGMVGRRSWLNGEALWWPKSTLTLIADTANANDDAPATQERFKVGDRVKIVDNMTPAGMKKNLEVGSEHTIVRAARTQPDAWILSGDELHWWPADQLLPATPEWQPKVGDPVRLKEVNHVESWGKAGEAGTISGICIEDGDAHVKFDDSGEWWAGLDNLQPLPVAAEAQGAGWMTPNETREKLGLPPLTAPLTIEADKFYKTRDGRKVGPIKKGNGWQRDWESLGNEFEPDYLTAWCKDGRFYAGEEHDFDLIAEWVEPAKPERKFKVGDRVKVKGGYLTGVVTSRNSRGAMSFISDGEKIAGPEFWYDDELIPDPLPTPTIGSTVTLAAPGIITGHNGPNVSVALPQGSYDLPLAALVSA